jgi:uncharacterized protein with GYD domain
VSGGVTPPAPLEVKGIYWTLRAIDGVIVSEAPDEKIAVAALLHLGSLGNMRTETVRAFDALACRRFSAGWPFPER